MTSNMPYGDYWRKHRHLLHQALNQREVQKYDRIQTLEVVKLLGHLLDDPKDFYLHVRLLV